MNHLRRQGEWLDEDPIAKSENRYWECCALAKTTARLVSQEKTFLALVLATPEIHRLSVHHNESMQHKLHHARKLYIVHRRRQRFKQIKSRSKSRQSTGWKRQISSEVMCKVAARDNFQCAFVAN